MSTEHAAELAHFKGEIQSCYINTLFHYCCIFIILMYQNTIQSTYANVLMKLEYILTRHTLLSRSVCIQDNKVITIKFQ